MDPISSRLMGRRAGAPLDDPSLQIWFVIAGMGRCPLVGILAFVIQMPEHQERTSCATPRRPWDGRTLEWSPASPPTAIQLAFTRSAGSRRVVRHEAARYRRPAGGYRDPHAAEYGAGVVLAVSRGARVRMIWYIWWGRVA